MSSWKHLIRFQATDGQDYFASLERLENFSQISGQSVSGFATFADLLKGEAGASVSVKQVRRRAADVRCSIIHSKASSRTDFYIIFVASCPGTLRRRYRLHRCELSRTYRGGKCKIGQLNNFISGRTLLISRIAVLFQLTVPADPVMWYKLKRALCGSGNVPIPHTIATGFLDFKV